MKRMTIVAVLAMAVILGMSARASAIAVIGNAFTLVDGDSEVSIDPDSSAGAKSWTFGGKDYLAQQWFWFRTEADGVYDDREYSIDEISGPAVDHVDPAVATITYADANVEAKVTYALADEAGPSGGSTLVETVIFTNKTGGSMKLYLFQYSDFELGGTADDMKVEILNGNLAKQTDTPAASVVILSETVVTSIPAGTPVSEVDMTGATLAKLMDANVNVLDGSTLLNGPGDLTWAFQWTLDIPSGQALLLSKIKDITIKQDGGGIVPEPAGLGLMAAALLTLRRRRR
ncbi:MAG: PEP-CTERM sorting domain-containing protein [Planctomycetota bacterium]